MAIVPSSPRARRRLAAVAGVSAVACAVAALVVLLPSRSPADAGPPAGAAPAQMQSSPREVPLRPAARRAIAATLDAFVRTAVRRKDVGASYDLATPALRAGMSRTEWARGAIPVMPFDASAAPVSGWTLNFSYPHDVGLDVLVQPRRTAEEGAISFRTELREIAGRWRVDSFYPVATFSPPTQRAHVQAEPDLAPHLQGTVTSGRLDPMWLLVPAGTLGLLLLVAPAALAVSSLRTRRRAEREAKALFALDRPRP